LDELLKVFTDPKAREMAERAIAEERGQTIDLPQKVLEYRQAMGELKKVNSQIATLEKKRDELQAKVNNLPPEVAGVIEKRGLNTQAPLSAKGLKTLNEILAHADSIKVGDRVIRIRQAKASVKGDTFLLHIKRYMEDGEVKPFDAQCLTCGGKFYHEEFKNETCPLCGVKYDPQKHGFAFWIDSRWIPEETTFTADNFYFWEVKDGRLLLYGHHYGFYRVVEVALKQGEWLELKSLL